MRLWHIDLLPLLPRQQLLGQHRECCALRGNGWGKKHAVVDYIFIYHPKMLFDYHMAVMEEMQKRGYSIDKLWKQKKYRGKTCYEDYPEQYYKQAYKKRYPEHNIDYLKLCLENLRGKGIVINIVEKDNKAGKRCT